MKIFIKEGVKVQITDPNIYHKYIEYGWEEYVEPKQKPIEQPKQKPIEQPKEPVRAKRKK